MFFSETARKCGDCTACCEGWLAGTVYGRTFYPGKKCHFLCDSGCSIYEERPKEPCKRFVCSWLVDTNKVYPEWLRPDLSGIIIQDKTTKSGISYLHITETGKKIDSEILLWCINYHLTTKKNMSIQINGGWNHFGDQDFCNEIISV